MMRSHTLPLVLGAVLSAAGCNGAGRESDADRPAPPDTGAMSGMQGMEGMAGMGGMMGPMMEQMTGHMQAMEGAGTDSMRAMLPMHRQMVANMIAQMNTEMRDMNMTTDAQWNATVDSLRVDLTRMPDMGQSELESFMTDHHGRVRRLMDMHRTMMDHMGM